MKFDKNKKGFSLVEVLIVMFIAAVIFTSFYTVSTVGTRYIIESKNRLAAVAILNEKMEIIRNLKYDDVGIVSGIPNGKIVQDEDVNENGKFFQVHTYIQYEDDDLDGVFPSDLISNDYKTVKVTISWKDSAGSAQKVDAVSRFVPPGLETSAGGAPLAINVKGSDGLGVNQASVHIINSAVSPALNFTVQTDNTGHIMIPAAPESLGGYQITVTKNGYETVTTQDSPSVDYLGANYTPTYTKASVLLNTLNMYDYIQDKLSSLTIKTTDYQNNPVGNFTFKISGGKVLGRDISNVNVFNLHDTSLTDVTSGEKVYSDISPGNYNIALDANAQYEFADYSVPTMPVVLTPDTNLVYEVKVADKNVNGLLINVLDSDTNASIMDAKFSLVDSVGASIFTEKTVSAQGVGYYPDSTTALLGGTYTLKVEAVNYITQEIPVTIDKLTKQEIKLVKI
ncbi:MAG: prepilin-type N-terminal cleavage/methylation domain-containing protein [bacterium]